MKSSNPHTDPDRLFRQAYHNNATDEEMAQAEELLQLMEQRIGKQIDHWETIEQITERRSISTTFKWIAGMAASLLLILAVSLVVKHQYEQQQYTQLQMSEDTFDNPEDAAAEAQRALLKFSEVINKAIE